MINDNVDLSLVVQLMYQRMMVMWLSWQQQKVVGWSYGGSTAWLVPLHLLWSLNTCNTLYNFIQIKHSIIKLRYIFRVKYNYIILYLYLKYTHSSIMHAYGVTAWTARISLDTFCILSKLMNFRVAKIYGDNGTFYGNTKT